MITDEQFLKIIKEKLKLNEDGSISITDPQLGQEYIGYLEQHAVSDAATEALGINVCINIYKCIQV